MKHTGMVKLMAVALSLLVFLSGMVAGCAEEALQPAAGGGDSGSEAFRTVGNVVSFGQYEQDNNSGNGPEAISWIVLDVDGDKALLLSKYGLEVKQYNTKYVRTTWETCSLRKWLNEEFCGAAFSPEEQSAILITDVDNSQEQSHPMYQAPCGNNTQDRIFLLSYAEANKYLDVTYENNDNVRARVTPTAYALAKGAWTKKGCKTEEGVDAGRWWLRSPGRHPNRASHIWGAGSVRDNQVTGGSRFFGFGLARPAMWIDLGSIAE